MAENISIPKEQLDGLLARLDKLESANKGYERAKRVTDRVANVRFHNGMPVIGYGNYKEIKDKETLKFVGYIDLTLLDVKSDKTSVETVPYLEFLKQSNFSLVQIIKQTPNERVISHGFGTTINPNPHFDRKFESGPVEYLETKVEYVSDVEVLEGEFKGLKFSIPNNALNA